MDQNVIPQIFEEVVKRTFTDTHVQHNRAIRYRPLARIKRPFSEVMKFEIELESSIKKNVVVKVFNPKKMSEKHLEAWRKRVRKDFEVTKMFFDAFKHYPGYSTAEPILCFPEILAITMEESLGVNFGDLVIRKAKLYPRKATLEELSEQSYECGRWLRIFQGITRQQMRGRFRLDGLIDDIDQRLRKLVSEQGSWFSSSLRSQVLNYLEKQASLVDDPDLDLCGVHADLSPSNVLINGREVIVLDFAMYKIGSVYHDVVYFYRSLENVLHKPIFRPGTIAILQESFLKGYNETVSPASPMFRLFKVRHVICHLVGVLDLGGSAIHERLFNKRVARRYVKWLRNIAGNFEVGESLVVGN